MSEITKLWFVKARRAANPDDDETWKQGGVCTTLNAFDNGGESRATVLIIDGTRVGDVRVTDEETMQTVIQRWGTGGGNVPAIAYSIREDATANNFSATEIEQARALQALQPSVQSHHAQTFIAQNVAPTLTAYNMDSRSPQSEEQQRIINSVYSNTLQVRRLTPMECERLQGFPDSWTATQSDSQRYRQMGNAVTVNVIESIGQQLGRVSNG
jgi:DNA (cytosine-5)-methyltransferase 1